MRKETARTPLDQLLETWDHAHPQPFNAKTKLSVCKAPPHVADHGAYVIRLRVDRQHRRRGVATQLLSELTRLADLHQLALWLVPVAKCPDFPLSLLCHLKFATTWGMNNRRLKQFYRKHGFRKHHGIYWQRPPNTPK